MAKKNSHPKKGAKKRYQIEVGSFSLLLWGCCALFFLAWVFVLGVFVGRGFLPGADSAFTDLKSQVAKFKEMTVRNKRGEQTLQNKELLDETFAFYEKLESKEGATDRKEGSGSAFKEGPAQRVQEQAKMETPKKDERIRAELPKPDHGIGVAPPPAGNGSYTLQLASLEEKAKAEAMVGDLLSKGYDAYFYEARVKGKTYYRVRCGRFMTRNEADEYAARLNQSLNIRGLVTRFE